MSQILPVFVSHYSYGQSVLTVEPAGESVAGNPSSIVDIAIENGLKSVVLIDETIDGFIESYKNCSAKNIQLIFGVKIPCCVDHTVKDEDSRKTESNIVIMVNNTKGYNDLIKIYNRAFTDNFYYHGRTSWKQLNELWTDNLTLCLPFFSSFIAKNALNLDSDIIPSLPCNPIVFKEIDSGIPFAPVIDRAIAKLKNHNFEEQNVKTIYYKNQSDFESFVTFRAIHERNSFEVPNLDNLCSNKFCWESYKQIAS